MPVIIFVHTSRVSDCYEKVVAEGLRAMNNISSIWICCEISVPCENENFCQCVKSYVMWLQPMKNRIVVVLQTVLYKNMLQ